MIHFSFSWQCVLIRRRSPSSVICMFFKNSSTVQVCSRTGVVAMAVTGCGTPRIGAISPNTSPGPTEARSYSGGIREDFAFPMSWAPEIRFAFISFLNVVPVSKEGFARVMRTLPFSTT